MKIGYGEPGGAPSTVGVQRIAEPTGRGCLRSALPGSAGPPPGRGIASETRGRAAVLRTGSILVGTLQLPRRGCRPYVPGTRRSAMGDNRMVTRQLTAPPDAPDVPLSRDLLSSRSGTRRATVAVLQHHGGQVFPMAGPDDNETRRAGLSRCDPHDPPQAIAAGVVDPQDALVSRRSGDLRHQHRVPE